MAISAFEQSRLEKIAANKKVLDDLFPEAEKIARPQPQKRVKVVKDASFTGSIDASVGTRRSSRISGIPAEKTILDDRITESYRKPVGYEHPVKTELIYDPDFFTSMKVDSDIKLESIGEVEKRSRVKSEPVVTRVSDLEANLRSLTLTFPAAIKVTPARITTSAWHPDPSNLMLAVADKFGNLGFLNVSAKLVDPDSSQVYLLNPHKSCISDINYIDSTTLLSCAYDGTVKKMDISTQQSTQVYPVYQIITCRYSKTTSYFVL
jgi:WD repeat-containing protein 76